MNEQLISGYTAFTTADEYGAVAVGEAPATSSWVVVLLSAAATYAGRC